MRRILRIGIVVFLSLIVAMPGYAKFDLNFDLANLALSTYRGSANFSLTDLWSVGGVVEKFRAGTTDTSFSALGFGAKFNIDIFTFFRFIKMYSGVSILYFDTLTPQILLFDGSTASTTTTQAYRVDIPVGLKIEISRNLYTNLGIGYSKWQIADQMTYSNFGQNIVLDFIQLPVVIEGGIGVTF